MAVMSLAEIKAAAAELSFREKEDLLKFLTDQLEGEGAVESRRERQAELHAGAWEVSTDFDAALPVEFWLGEDG
jgi:hypothetical protein